MNNKPWQDQSHYRFHRTTPAGFTLTPPKKRPYVGLALIILGVVMCALGLWIYL